jgi:hypothetical protein
VLRLSGFTCAFDPTWGILAYVFFFSVSSLILAKLLFFHGYSVEVSFVGLAYQGKDIVFRFIIEYSSLMDFWRLGNRSIFM